MADGRASTSVGGFTIISSAGTASNGIFTSVFIIQREGSRTTSQAFANDASGIYAAAQRVQLATFGGVVEDVAEWVASGGAASLEAQARQQAQSQISTETKTEDTETVGDPTPANEAQTAKEVEGQGGESTDGETQTGVGATADDIAGQTEGGGGPVKAVTTAPQPDPPYYGYSKFSGIYKVISIKNSFSSGKFEQTLSLARVYQTNEIIEKAKEQEKIVDKQTAKEVVTPLKHVPVIPAKLASAFPSVLNAKIEGGGDILKAVGDAASGVTNGIKDIAGSVGDALSAVGDGVGQALETVSGAIKDPSGAISRLSTLKVDGTNVASTVEEEYTGGGLVDSEGRPVLDGSGNAIRTGQ